MCLPSTSRAAPHSYQLCPTGEGASPGHRTPSPQNLPEGILVKEMKENHSSLKGRPPDTPHSPHSPLHSFLFSGLQVWGLRTILTGLSALPQAVPIVSSGRVKRPTWGGISLRQDSGMWQVVTQDQQAPNWWKETGGEEAGKPTKGISW
jgi:hypothetical protein